MRALFTLLALVPLGFGCSALVDSSKYTGGTDSGTDAGDAGDAGDTGVDPCISDPCPPGENCVPDGEGFMCVGGPDPCEGIPDPLNFCVDGNCCDCDGDSYLKEIPACPRPPEDPPDCNDDDGRVWPGAPPQCSTEGPDNCGEEFSQQISEILSTLWPAGGETGGIQPRPVFDPDTGDPIVVHGKPQVSVARFNPGSDERAAVVAYQTDEPGSGAAQHRINILDSDYFSFEDASAADIIPSAIEEGTDVGIRITPDGTGLVRLIDNRMNVFRGSGGSYDVIHSVALGSSMADAPRWPLTIDPAPMGAPGFMIRYRREAVFRGLLAIDGMMTTESRGVGLTLDADSGHPLRSAGPLAMARVDGSATGGDEIGFWDGTPTSTGTTTYNGVVNQGTYGDITRLPGMAFNYIVAYPGGAASLRGLFTFQVNCTGPTAGGCSITPRVARRAVPETVGEPHVALTSVAPPGMPGFVVAPYTIPNIESMDDAVAVYFLDAVGNAVEDPSGNPLWFPMLESGFVFGDRRMVLRSIEAITAQSSGGNVDVLIVMAASDGGDASELWIGGLRYCAP